MPELKRAKGLIALIIVTAFVVYLLGNGGASLVDRDEPRYAQTSRQMLQSGDWIVPRLYDQPRTAKPVGIYWFQAAAMRAMGDTPFAARFPSALAMPITLLLVGAAVMRWAGPRRAVWTVFVLATSVLVIIAAKVCLTDSVLLVFITIAQGCLYLCWRRRGRWTVIVAMGVAIGLAGLVKGPVVVGIMATTALALWGLNGLDALIERRRARTGMVVGPIPAIPRRGANVPLFVLKSTVVFLIVALIVGPWLYAVHVRAPSFIGTSLSHDVVNRVSSGLEGHSAPPGYHLASIWGTYLPWSILLPMTMVFAFKRRHIPQVRFAIAAVIGPWIMLEIVRTKLPHYMLPVFPFLAFLTADAIVRCLRGQHDDLVRPQFIRAIRIMAIVIVLAGALPSLLLLKFHNPLLPGIIVLIFAAAVMYTVVIRFSRLQPRRGLIALGVGSFALFTIFWMVYLPHADALRLSIRVADVLRSQDATGPHDVIMLDYKEPSLAFYQGGTIRENSATVLTDELLDHAPQWLVLTRDVWNARGTTASARRRVETIDSLRGLAYADGLRTVDVMIVRKK